MSLLNLNITYFNFIIKKWIFTVKKYQFILGTQSLIYSQKEIEMTNNNSLITGELNSTTKKNVPEKVDQVLIDASKNKEKESFRRALEAFSDCI